MARNVLVTGASSGIGRATAIAFAKQGDNVLLCARRFDSLERLKQEIETHYAVRVAVLVLDVRDRQAVETKLLPAVEAFGGIDVLVNNAGLAQGLEPFQHSDMEDAVTMVDTNIKGLLYVTRQVLPLMVAGNAGHIVNIGSTAGSYTYPNAAVYCATKAAVRILSDGIRMDTIETDIKVTNIQPGITETAFSEVRFHGDKTRAAAVYQGIEALQPEDIADAILYACNQPKRVQVSDITIVANQQAGTMKAKK